MIAGIGTGVGKTIVSAILTTLLNGDYWKPIQSGEPSDTDMVKKLIDLKKHRIHLPAYSLKARLSPHHAAILEDISINVDSIIPPNIERPLIIESVGGIFVPLTTKTLSMDLFKSWNCKWVVVSRHYLGSINHTLLTIQALKEQNVSIAGLIFNGASNPESESVILEISKLALLGRLLPELDINQKTIQKYAKNWKPCLPKLIR